MQQMDSIRSQPDIRLRTADFFDDDSSEDNTNLDPASVAPDVELLDRRGSAGKKRHSTLSTEPLASQCESKTPIHEQDHTGYQRLTPSISYEEHHRIAENPGSSLISSIDELLPDRHSTPPVPPKSRIRENQPLRSSSQIERTEDPTPKPEQTLGAYAIAHEITLQALMRDENALDSSLRSFPLAPLQTGYRHSLLPTSLRMHDDPRSPHNRHFSSPEVESKRHVHVVPPPIDTSVPQRAIPHDIVRTPYPFPEVTVHRKDFGHLPNSATVGTNMSNAESILIVAIRRSNPNSRARFTNLTIPVSNDFSAVRSRSMGAKEQHFKALDFDDEELFRQIRSCYNALSGPGRFLSARSLTRIAVTGGATKAADIDYRWLSSPQLSTPRGFGDTFNEDRILQYYRKPALGKSRYAFVQWAHRLAAAGQIRTSQAEDETQRPYDAVSRRRDQTEGLEFVVSWSAKRIFLALLVVVVASMAATFLWIFLGHVTSPEDPSHGGFRDAGDRITSGILMGVCILLLGLSCMAGWLGVSWLAM